MVPSGLHYKHWSSAVVLSYCASGESYIRWTYFIDSGLVHDSGSPPTS